MTAIVDIPLTPREALVGLTCEGMVNRRVDLSLRLETCGQPALAIVWRPLPGDRQRALCPVCADQHVRNHMARVLLVAHPDLRLALARIEHERRGEWDPI